MSHPLPSEAQQVEDKLPKVRQAEDEGRGDAGGHVQGRGHAVVVFHFDPGDLPWGQKRGGDHRKTMGKNHRYSHGKMVVLNLW